MTYQGQTRIANFKPKREDRKRAKSPAEKRPGNNPEYLAKLRQLPCCICYAPAPSQVHHLKATGERGAGKRSSDRWGLAMCHDCHLNGVERVGSRRERAWFDERGVQPLTLAAALYANRHSLDAMRAVLGAQGGEDEG